MRKKETTKQRGKQSKHQVEALAKGQHTKVHIQNWRRIQRDYLTTTVISRGDMYDQSNCTLKLHTNIHMNIAINTN